MVVVRAVDKAGAVAARQAGGNVKAVSRQMAKQIETAASGGKPVIKHKGHDLDRGTRGSPHYQTEGQRGHTFWGAGAAGVAGGETDYAQFARNVGEFIFEIVFGATEAYAPEMPQCE
jgi:hypothetical protein